MKTAFVSLLLCLHFTAQSSWAQLQNNNWFIGIGLNNGRILQWIGGEPQVVDTTELGFKETSAIVSDPNGNLLFYSNGCKIYNRLHEPMLNGDSLPCEMSGWLTPYPNTEMVALGSEDTNPALIVQSPADSSQYYFFLRGEQNFNDVFFYNIVDMTLDGGLGGVVLPRNRVIREHEHHRLDGKVAAIRHANGRDWWIFNSGFQLVQTDPFTWDYDYTVLHSYLLTPAGITDSFSQPYCYAATGLKTIEGEISVSLNGDRIAICHINKTIVAMDFDRCTGLISNCQVIDTVPEYNIDIGNKFRFGLALSPDGSVLYATSGVELFQYDLSSANPASSKQLIFYYPYYTNVPDTRRTLGELQLGPDNKLYFTRAKFQHWIYYPQQDGPTHWMLRLNSPDSLGAACDVQDSVLYIGVSTFGLPNLVNWNLGKLEGSECDTLTSVPTDLVQEQNVVAQLFPNPATTDATLVLSKPAYDEMDFALYDVFGKISLTLTVPQNQKYVHIDLSSLSEGVYFYRLGGPGKQTHHGKLLKTNSR